MKKSSNTLNIVMTMKAIEVAEAAEEDSVADVEAIETVVTEAAVAVEVTEVAEAAEVAHTVTEGSVKMKMKYTIAVETRPNSSKLRKRDQRTRRRTLPLTTITTPHSEHILRRRHLRQSSHEEALE